MQNKNNSNALSSFNVVTNSQTIKSKALIYTQIKRTRKKDLAYSPIFILSLK